MLNHSIGHGKIAEAGGEFVGPTQDRILALASAVGVDTFDAYDTGDNIYVNGAVRLRYADTVAARHGAAGPTAARRHHDAHPADRPAGEGHLAGRAVDRAEGGAVRRRDARDLGSCACRERRRHPRPAVAVLRSAARCGAARLLVPVRPRLRRRGGRCGQRRHAGTAVQRAQRGAAVAPGRRVAGGRPARGGRARVTRAAEPAGAHDPAGHLRRHGRGGRTHRPGAPCRCRSSAADGRPDRLRAVAADRARPVHAARRHGCADEGRSGLPDAVLARRRIDGAVPDHERAGRVRLRQLAARWVARRARRLRRR